MSRDYDNLMQLRGDVPNERKTEENISMRTFRQGSHHAWELDFADELESLRLSEENEAELFDAAAKPSGDRYFNKKLPAAAEKRTKLQNTKSNYSFTDYQSREIERTNLNLLRRIKTTKPSVQTQRPNPVRKTTSSAAINAKKSQLEIERQNLILLRKLKTIACRKKRTFT